MAKNLAASLSSDPGEAPLESVANSDRQPAVAAITDRSID